MGKGLRRVPLDFDYPIGKVWYGYYLSPSFCHQDSAGCEGCREFARIKGVELDNYGCPDFYEFYNVQLDIDPPKGEGYQLWEITSEDKPVTPVFKTLEDLCEHCENKKITTYGYRLATAEEWMNLLKENFVHHKQGNCIFF